MLASFAPVFVTLFVAHQVADHWGQTSHQAACKGTPGWAGRRACAAHVATYTLIQIVILAVVVSVLHLHLSPVRVSVGLLVSAVTHYIADRRTPLRRVADAFGLAGFYTLGVPRPGHDDNPSLGTGAYALDQSFHLLWLFVAALVIA